MCSVISDAPVVRFSSICRSAASTRVRASSSLVSRSTVLNRGRISSPYCTSASCAFCRVCQASAESSRISCSIRASSASGRVVGFSLAALLAGRVTGDATSLVAGLGCAAQRLAAMQIPHRCFTMDIIYFCALFQSSRNRFNPISVSGWNSIFSITLNGIVATSAPALAASTA